MIVRSYALICGLAALALATPAWAASDKGTVLVVGATGQTGRPLVKILKAEGYDVRAMVRGTTTAAELGADTVIQGDVTKPETLPPAVKGATYVVSVIGARGATPEEVDQAGNIALTDAAKAAGVKQLLLVTSIGAEITDVNDPSVRRGATMIAKGKAEAHLRKSGVPYTIIRPGALVNCDAGKNGVKLGLRSARENQTNPIPPICRADIATVMAASLGNKDAIGKTFSVSTDPNGKPGEWRSTFAALKKD